jgi:hypothetical protein
MSMKLRNSWVAKVAPLLLALATASPAVAQSTMAAHGAHEMADAKKFSNALIDKVRNATRRYVDINIAMHEGWTPATPCVSGPQEGAMGVHFVLPSRLGDGVLEPDEPEALIYEPMPNGTMRLVGVEFIVFASDWANLHPDGGAPSVDGHLANYVGEPNRYGLHAFYELHVWAWEHNPSGTFADWNTNVSCDSQRGS